MRDELGAVSVEAGSLSGVSKWTGREGGVGETRQGLPTPPLGLPLLITVEEAAELLRLGRTRTYEFIRSGLILSVKLGRSRLVVRASLDEFVERLIADQYGQLD